MAQRLIIKWKNIVGMLPPYTESYLCKSEEAADKILGKRRVENIESAKFIDKYSHTVIMV